MVSLQTIAKTAAAPNVLAVVIDGRIPTGSNYQRQARNRWLAEVREIRRHHTAFAWLAHENAGAPIQWRRLGGETLP